MPGAHLGNLEPLGAFVAGVAKFARRRRGFARRRGHGAVLPGSVRARRRRLLSRRLLSAAFSAAAAGAAKGTAAKGL